MTELNKAQIDENIQLMIQLRTTGMPDGAVLEFWNDLSDEWRTSSQQDRIYTPYLSRYRIALPKPAPHPTLLSIVEHGCFPQDWDVEHFTANEDGRIYAHDVVPFDGTHVWHCSAVGRSVILAYLNTTEPNWKQCIWTLSELRDIIKQNAASQGSIKRNTVALSEAEQYCLTCYESYRKLDAFSIGDEPRWEIGQRIAEQRQEAQS